MENKQKVDQIYLALAIEELDEAIKKFSKLKRKLYAKSRGYWNSDIEKVADMIDQLKDARERLCKKQDEFEEKSCSLKTAEDYVNKPLVDVELLTQIIIQHHDNYTNSVKSDVDMAKVADAIKALEQEPCEDAISRKSIKQKLQEHHDFFVNAYGGFSNLPLNDKSRVDEITNCIAMVVNEPPVTPQEPFINKPCVSSAVCEHDKQKVLDKLRAEIEELPPWNEAGVFSSVRMKRMVLDIFDKYKAENNS